MKLIPRRDTTEKWEGGNPVLDDGELAREYGVGMKIGDGETPWNELGYFTKLEISEIKVSSYGAGLGRVYFITNEHPKFSTMEKECHTQNYLETLEIQQTKKKNSFAKWLKNVLFGCFDF